MFRKAGYFIGFSVLFIISIFFIACSKESAGASNGIVKEHKKAEAVILHKNTALYKEVDEVMKVQKNNANIADIVGWKNKVKEALRYDNVKRNFALIDIDGEDYWVQTVFVASDAVPGVIIGNETILYSKPDITKATSSIIPEYSLVAVHPDTESEIFVSISAYVDGEKPYSVEQKFIKKENVTIFYDDVQAMKLYTIANAAENEVVKRELLKNALELDSGFKYLIRKELGIEDESDDNYDPDYYEEEYDEPEEDSDY